MIFLVIDSYNLHLGLSSRGFLLSHPPSVAPCQNGMANGYSNSWNAPKKPALRCERLRMITLASHGRFCGRKRLIKTRPLSNGILHLSILHANLIWLT